MREGIAPGLTAVSVRHLAVISDSRLLIIVRAAPLRANTGVGIAVMPYAAPGRSVILTHGTPAPHPLSPSSPGSSCRSDVLQDGDDLADWLLPNGKALH